MTDAFAPKPLVLEEFFSAPVRVEGTFLNVWSRVRLGIVIEIVPAWDGRVLSLDERFTYSDGTADHKVWRLEKTGAGTYAGSREDMIGTGRVWTEDSAVRLSYVLLLAGMGFTFDETMMLRDDATMYARSTVKKWGILIGRVELTMRRTS
ncbi:MAG: DUF3833 family protein [Proteobacteria bacterium]|nr:DUF3833 family protein [Pseudomonadota bacterium]